MLCTFLGSGHAGARHYCRLAAALPCPALPLQLLTLPFAGVALFQGYSEQVDCDTALVQGMQCRR